MRHHGLVAPGDVRDLAHLTLVIGAMKAGTSSLFAYLSDHPAVCPSTIKELQFFSDDDRWARGETWYRSMFDWDPAVHRTALDASPRYSKVHSHPRTVERLRSFPADMHFVYLVRDPVTRIESHYVHARARGWLDDDRPLADRIPPELIEVTRYATQARPYVDAFGRERLLIVRFEDMVAQPEATVHSICHFVGIDPDQELAGLGQRHNDAGSRVATGTAVRKIRRSRFGRTVAKAVPPRVRAPIIRRTAEDASVFKLSESQRDEVGAVLADELRALRDDLGVDLRGWTVPVP